jgi:trimeric autotransporter adhesin
VNPVTNKIYVTNNGDASVTVIDGATNTTNTVAAGRFPIAIAVNPTNNMVYVANGGNDTVTLIDGVTNTTNTVAARGFPFAIAVNPITNQVYVANNSSNNVTVISPSTDTLLPLPLTTAITATNMIAGTGNATGNTTPSFIFTPSSTYAPATPAIRTVYYQLDSTSGNWIQATGTGPFTATLPTQAKGSHVLYAFAVDSLEGGATGGSSGLGSGNSPMVGSVAAFAFTVIDPLAQIITGFAPASPVALGATAATLTATSGASGNAIMFSTTSAASICTVVGNLVTYVGAGICNLTANQAGNANYVAAPQVTASITINQAAQTIIGFAPTTPVIFGATAVTLTATGGASGNAIMFGTTSAASICTVVGNLVTYVGAGTCNLTADQAGNANYVAAPQVTASITINQAAQTIIGFAPPTPVIFGAAPATLPATGGASGNAIMFGTTSAASICTVVGNLVTYVGAGICNLTADQAGNANYLVAPQITLSITINQAAQIITIAATPASLFTNAAPFTVTATGGASANAVTFSTTTPLICTSGGVNGSLITLTQQNGTCTIRANQLGNANYLAANPVDRSIAIGTEPPPPPPTTPTNLVCTASVVIAGSGTIDCRYTASTSESSRNPIQSYRLYCTNDTTSSAIQITVAASQTRATINNAIVGRYTCNVTAQGLASASAPSNLARVVLSAMPLSLSNQFDAEGRGFATILVRSSASSVTESTEIKATTNTTQIGRFDGTRFNFTPTTDIGEGWNILGLGDVTGSNNSSVIGRNAGDDVRVDTGLLSTVLRKAKSDWSLEAVTDLDGDGKADMVWRYMKPGSNDSGVIFAWYMNTEPTLNINEVKHRGGAPLDWSLIGAADIDGDGKGDLIWLSPSNEIRSLTSKAGRTWVNERIGQLPAGYSIVKLGDVNGDGKGDIIFKDAAGRVKVWLMDGSRVALDVDMPAIAASTTFYAAGDFDGDGTMDIVWKKADGTLLVWLMNKTVINQPTVIDNAGVAPVGVVVE